ATDRFVGPINRGGTCPNDQLYAPPAIKLNKNSPQAFKDWATAKSHANDDIVIVGTYDHECTGGARNTPHNRLLAYWASDLSTAWTFNQTGTYAVDFFSDGCSIDYTNSRVYCGTHHPDPPSTQNTLWAISTVPKLTSGIYAT